MLIQLGALQNYVGKCVRRVHRYIDVRVCMYLSIYACTYIHRHIYNCIHTHTHTHMCQYRHTHRYVCIDTHINAKKYIFLVTLGAYDREPIFQPFFLPTVSLPLPSSLTAPSPFRPLRSPPLPPPHPLARRSSANQHIPVAGSGSGRSGLRAVSDPGGRTEL